MKNTCACSHPLYITRVNDATVACAVVVCHTAFVSNGHCFKTFVRMHIHTSNGFARPKTIFRIKVQHQEGAYPALRNIGAGYKIIHPETITHHTWLCRAWHYFFNCLFHICFFLFFCSRRLDCYLASQASHSYTFFLY